MSEGKVIHDLKCWSEHYLPVEQGYKKVELRRDDRDYQEGDFLCLREYDPNLGEYLGPSCYRRITHIVRGGPWLVSGYAALSIEDVGPPSCLD